MLETILDRAIRRALAESPRAAALCAGLSGHALALEVGGTPWRTRIESTGTTLSVHRGDRDARKPADATLSGSPLALLALTGAQGQAVIQRGDVRIEGDAEIAQQFRELVLLLRPDLETALAPLFGRLPAHLALRGLRGAAAWTRHAAHTSIANVAEYLAHERRALVPRAEAEAFLRDVEALSDQLARLDARLHHLEQRSIELAGGPERRT
jgi:ubiquinone biosynthesis protein UbiJ